MLELRCFHTVGFLTVIFKFPISGARVWDPHPFYADPDQDFEIFLDPDPGSKYVRFGTRA